MPDENLKNQSGQQVSKLKLASIEDLLSQTWAFYKKRVKVLWLILAIPAAFNIIYVFLSAVPTRELAWPGAIFISIFAVILALAGALANLWAGLALVFAIKDEIDFKQAFIQAWHKLLSYIWLSILSSLVITGGFLLFFVPGVVLSIWFVFGVYILVIEGPKGREALLKSRAYVKGYWWSIFGRLLLVGLLVTVIAGLANGFAFLFALFLKQLAFIFDSLFGALITILVGPISLIYVFVIYQDIKTKKPDLVFQPTKKAKRYLVLWAAWAIVALILITSLVLGVLWFYFFSENDWAKMARDASRRADQAHIMMALERYYYHQGQWPNSLTDLKPDYLPDFPQDPKERQDYEYRLTEDGQNFLLCIDFEKKERACFDKNNIETRPGFWYEDWQEPPQLNLIWKRFANIPTQWFSALIGARNLLLR